MVVAGGVDFMSDVPIRLSRGFRKTLLDFNKVGGTLEPLWGSRSITVFSLAGKEFHSQDGHPNGRAQVLRIGGTCVCICVSVSVCMYVCVCASV